MKFIRSLLRLERNYQKSSLADSQRELVEAGREQFKKLIDQGLGIPVGLS